MNNTIITYIETRLSEAATNQWQFNHFKFAGVKSRSQENTKHFDFGAIEVIIHSKGHIDVLGDFYKNSIRKNEYNSAQDAVLMIYDQLRYADQNYQRLLTAPENWAQKGFLEKVAELFLR